MHVACRRWHAIRLKLYQGKLRLTCKETLACLIICLKFHADKTIASDVLFVATTEVINALVFDHTKGDRPVNILPHFIHAQMDSLIFISRGIECGDTCTRTEWLEYLQRFVVLCCHSSAELIFNIKHQNFSQALAINVQTSN